MSKNKRKNTDPDLDWLYEDQSLTSEVEPGSLKKQQKKTFRESLSYTFRSMLALFLCLVIPVLWYFNWNFSAFLDSTSGAVNNVFERQEAGIVGAPEIPDIPDLPFSDLSETTDAGLAEYLSEFKELPYADRFSNIEVRAFYQSGLDISYLDQLNETGMLDDFSFPAVITFYNTGVTMEYLNQMREGDYFEQFSYPAIASFYSSGVTVDFLDELRAKELLDDLSFPDILVMFQSR